MFIGGIVYSPDNAVIDVYVFDYIQIFMYTRHKANGHQNQAEMLMTIKRHKNMRV